MEITRGASGVLRAWIQHVDERLLPRVAGLHMPAATPTSSRVKRPAKQAGREDAHPARQERLPHGRRRHSSKATELETKVDRPSVHLRCPVLPVNRSTGAVSTKMGFKSGLRVAVQGRSGD
ncbi:hypothetical protein GCM10010844_35990 [Deinococcus radiotolerans]|uniref:Uncharacterized protein n=1 Tax=Deinococcus radiotolerans TaxID=1309407 RepID=A0ABQ2FPG1_9DEIO|nr:hypothetical protein GCM10010844_35990 [Deinococcus radiotolerans]